MEIQGVGWSRLTDYHTTVVFWVLCLHRTLHTAVTRDQIMGWQRHM